jgi:hypothetical protein
MQGIENSVKKLQRKLMRKKKKNGAQYALLSG